MFFQKERQKIPAKYLIRNAGFDPFPNIRIVPRIFLTKRIIFKAILHSILEILGVNLKNIHLI